MHDTDLAATGALIGDPSRARMLDALMGGRALAAGELARIAGVGASTASEHLARLRDGGLVEVVAHGRHRYYRIAGPDVGAALEALSQVAPPRPVRSLRQSGHAQALGFARTCYDHLAGACGVALHDAMIDRGWLTRAYDVTPAGHAGLAGWGVDVGAARARRRSFARPCLDWTERRPHLAGSLAAGITDGLVERGWFVRRSADSRALRLTDAGRAGMQALGCDLSPSATR
ncbi:ArsR/SmtB family transcription factor [Nocardioides sp. URHA0032]|uniref:ArsR/SmtB family transcription factor n=1 Tax=Nocardioides sp. URHA0032 TaxID=1380388 RepID=UPI000490AA7E|nr:winged helix-turn-helix domain-containing protein [Nocardioides sp. URHA0032]